MARKAGAGADQMILVQAFAGISDITDVTELDAISQKLQGKIDIIFDEEGNA